MAKHIQAAVAAPDLEVAIISAVPLIDVPGYLNLPAVKANAAWLRGNPGPRGSCEAWIVD